MIDLGAPDPMHSQHCARHEFSGQIVGDTGACTDDPNDPLYFSTFYVEKGKPPVDLNALITPASEIHLEDAGDINDLGEISAGGVARTGLSMRCCWCRRPTRITSRHRRKDTVVAGDNVPGMSKLCHGGLNLSDTLHETRPG